MKKVRCFCIGFSGQAPKGGLHMLNRYYAVGERICDEKINFFSGTIYLRDLTKEELEQKSFFKNPTIKIFRSFDEAKQFAEKEQKSALSCAHIQPKTPIIRKISPIFTIDLSFDFPLGSLHSELRSKPYFYLVKSEDIDRTNIIRAEFHNSDLTPVEFKPPVQKRTCAIL